MAPESVKLSLSENGGHLLNRFNDGISYFENDQPVAVKSRGKVARGVVLDDETSPYTVLFDGSMVLASRNFLNHLGQFNFEMPVTVPRVDGEIVFVGMMLDYPFLLGLEEAHHAYIFPRFISLFSDPLSVPLKVYDAQKNELAALIYQLEVAIRIEMPLVTIGCIRNRIEAARRVRREWDLFRGG